MHLFSHLGHWSWMRARNGVCCGAWGVYLFNLVIVWSRVSLQCKLAAACCFSDGALLEPFLTSGETKIGISYEKLAQSVKPGGRILVSDGTLSIEVRGG